jgi:hypothetical protein
MRYRPPTIRYSFCVRFSLLSGRKYRMLRSSRYPSYFRSCISGSVEQVSILDRLRQHRISPPHYSQFHGLLIILRGFLGVLPGTIGVGSCKRSRMVYFIPGVLNHFPFCSTYCQLTGNAHIIQYRDEKTKARMTYGDKPGRCTK